MEYHKKIKQFRELRNYTQEHMADQLKISQRSYSSIENGQTQLTVDRLFEISEALQISIGEIIGSENQYIYNNNFNNNATQNKGNLIFNQDNFIEQKELYERIIKSKEDEIEILKNVLKSNI
jgi:transcriptional regulator with XRE-family HTH domain